MGLLAYVFVYILGGITALPLLVALVAAVALWTSVPVGDVDPSKRKKQALQEDFEEKEKETNKRNEKLKLNMSTQSKPRKGWVVVRRTFDDSESSIFDGSYMDIMRSMLDTRSKELKKQRPKDTYFAVLKGSVLFLYEDEAMTECQTALEMSKHIADIYPEGLLDAELFTKRNAIIITAQDSTPSPGLSHVTKEMKLGDDKVAEEAAVITSKDPEASKKVKELNDKARERAFDFSTPWFIFVRSVAEMEDWYLALVHASKHPVAQSVLEPLEPVFSTEHMQYLVSHLDTQPDPIPMRWFNALIGRLFFSVYKTAAMENFIIGRLMKKLSKVKKPNFLADIVVTQVSVGETAPTFFKPMLKELTKEGDAAVEVGVHYQGEIRITVETTATISLGTRFGAYDVKLVLAVVLRELEGNLLIKVKRPPSNRIWYAFTKMPRMNLSVEPIVSDRQLTWGVVLKTIEGRIKEVILESVVLPNYDDIAFFETTKLQQRGGIFADAVRKPLEKQAAPAPVSETQSAGVETLAHCDDGMDDFKIPGGFSTASLPLPTPKSEEQLPPATIHQRAVSIAAPPSAYPSSTPFGTVTVEHPSHRPKVEADAEKRGRPLESDANSGVLSQHIRGTSLPATNRDSMEGEADQGLHLPNKRETARSSPVPSMRRATHSSSQSVDVPSQPASPVPIPTASTFSLDSTVGSSDSKPSTGSLLGNLKARTAAAVTAAEVSNPKAVAQARETLNKWGAQWAGLKKNLTDARSGSGSSSPAASTFAVSTPAEYTPNTPPSGSISRGFDDMRKIVAERKQREERERVVSDVGKSTPLEVPFDSKSKRRESAGPVLLSNAESGNTAPRSNQPTAPATPLRSRLGRSDSIGNASAPSEAHETLAARFIQPLAAKTVPTVVETLLDASPSHPGEPTATLTSYSNKPSSPTSAGFKSAPIMAQPSYSAMSMVVPGINAKNRNEVMSIGFSPPPAATPPPAPKEEGGLGTKLQGIGNIGNIYRLLNRNNAEGLDGKTPSGALNATPTPQPEDEAQYATAPEADTRKSVGPPATPPRSASYVDNGGNSPRQSMDAGSSSPASAALLSLVQRDEIARRKSLTRRRTGSMGEYPQRSDSTSSSPLASGVVIPVTSEPEEAS